jgi:cell division protein FtsW
MNHKFLKVKGEILLLVLVVFLALFGVVMVYSSSNYSALADYGDKFFFAKKQLLGFFVGLIGMISMCFYSHHKLAKIKWISLAVSLILLAVVFIPGLGKESYGADRWIIIGPITIQPSEIAKFGFVIFSAAYISEKPEKIKTLIGSLPIILAGSAICVLIILEPNMSITMCVGLLMLAILFIGGMEIKYFLIVLIPFLILVPLLIIIEPYRLNRLSAFLNPWASPKDEGYQLIQSLYALGSGGWFGVGLFNSRQKFEFLPFAESDFILSVIGEEFGFIGVLIIFLIMMVVIYIGLKIVANSKNLFSYILASGITMIYALQVIINALVVTGTIPPTGLPLPLISAGNTSLIVFMSAMGILYNISIYNNQKTLGLKV